MKTKTQKKQRIQDNKNLEVNKQIRLVGIQYS